MGSIIGKVTDAVGLTNHEAEEDAARLAQQNSAAGFALSKEQIALMKEQLEFQKEQYEDWKGIYGDIQDNLGEYYNDLNEDDLVALGLQNQQREYQEAVKLIKRDAAQRGITDSGLEFAATTSATFQNAEARAKIRTGGAKEVAEQQLSFLGVGLGQGAQLLGNINNASSNVNNAFNTGVNARTNTAANFIQQRTQFGLANIEAMGQIVGTAVGFAGGG